MPKAPHSRTHATMVVFPAPKKHIFIIFLTSVGLTYALVHQPTPFLALPLANCAVVGGVVVLAPYRRHHHSHPVLVLLLHLALLIQIELKLNYIKDKHYQNHSSYPRNGGVHRYDTQ